MASAAGSRMGLIAATVVMSIVAVTALIFAAIFYASTNRAEKSLEVVTKSYRDVTRDPTGATVSSIKSWQSAEGSKVRGEPYLEASYHQAGALAKLVSGQEDVTTAEAAATTALANANEAMKGAGLGEVNPTENMAQTITNQANAIKQMTAQIMQLKDSAAQAKAQEAQTVKDTAAQRAAKDKEIAGYQQQVTETQNKVNAATVELQGTSGANAKTIEEASKQYGESLQKEQQGRADAERNYAAIQKQNRSLEAKLAQFRPDAKQSMLRQADGYISRINSDGSVYISLGAGQGVTPGMTFEVYDKVNGVPAMKADETTMPVGKGSLEVLRVNATTSECRLVKATAGRAMGEGDIIANLVYDKNTKLKFVVYGKFDLTHPGSPDAADANILKQRVGEWGGVLQPELTVDTDFLVIGPEPRVPDFDEEKRRDPVNAKALADAQAEVDAYRAVLNKATDYSIPILNQNRFLYYTGYFDSAKR